MSLLFDNIVWYTLWYLFLGSLPCSAGDSDDKLYLNSKKPCDTYGDEMDIVLSGDYDDMFHFKVGVNLHRIFGLEDYIKVELGYGPFSPFPLFEDYVCNKKMLDCRKTCGYFDYDISLPGFKLEAGSEFYISVKLNGIVNFCKYFSLEEFRGATGKIYCPDDTVISPPRVDNQDYPRDNSFNNVRNWGRIKPPEMRVGRNEGAVDNKVVKNEPVPSQSDDVESDHQESVHSTDFLPPSKAPDEKEEEAQPEVETQKQRDEEPQPVERRPQEDENLLVAQLEVGNDEPPHFENKQQGEVDEGNEDGKQLIVQLDDDGDDDDDDKQKQSEAIAVEEPVEEPTKEEAPEQSEPIAVEEPVEEPTKEEAPEQSESIAVEEPVEEPTKGEAPEQPEAIAVEEPTKEEAAPEEISAEGPIKEAAAPEEISVEGSMKEPTKKVVAPEQPEAIAVGEPMKDEAAPEQPQKGFFDKIVEFFHPGDNVNDEGVNNVKKESVNNDNDDGRATEVKVTQESSNNKESVDNDDEGVNNVKKESVNNDNDDGRATEVKVTQESSNNKESVDDDDEGVIDEKDTGESSETINAGAVKGSSPSSKKKRRKSHKRFPKQMLL